MVSGFRGKLDQQNGIWLQNGASCQESCEIQRYLVRNHCITVIFRIWKTGAKFMIIVLEESQTCKMELQIDRPSISHSICVRKWGNPLPSQWLLGGGNERRGCPEFSKSPNAMRKCGLLKYASIIAGSLKIYFTKFLTNLRWKLQLNLKETIGVVYLAQILLVKRQFEWVAVVWTKKFSVCTCSCCAAPSLTLPQM